MIIKNWFRMKQKEIKCKLAVFTALETLLKEKQDMVRLAGDIYASLKDTPADELQEKLIAAAASLSHVHTEDGHN